jgi:predicted metal-dependent phosphoesterase TrpH
VNKRKLKRDYQNLARNRAFYKVVDFEYLKIKGYKVYDMHIHTRYSDSSTKISKILKKAEKLGIGIAITDHNEIQGVIDAFNKKSSVSIIPGIEISSEEGPHVLLYFYKLRDLKNFYYEFVLPNKKKNPNSFTTLKVKTILDNTDPEKCIRVFAHPFSPAYTNLPKCIDAKVLDSNVLKQIDGIEVINGALLHGWNKCAISFADYLDKCFTGGTDAHNLYEVGRIVTYARANNSHEFLDKIKAKENFVVGKSIGQVRRIPSLTKCMGYHMPYMISGFPDRFKRFVWRGVIYRGGQLRHGVSRINILRLPLTGLKLKFGNRFKLFKRQKQKRKKKKVIYENENRNDYYRN